MDSWAPVAAKKMREILDTMQNITVAEPVITIKSTMNDAVIAQMEALSVK